MTSVPNDDERARRVLDVLDLDDPAFAKLASALIAVLRSLPDDDVEADS